MIFMDNKNPHNICRSFIDILRTGLAIILLAIFVIPCQAQGLESGNDYYFRRYNELINEGNDVDKAMDLLNKQLELTPRNVEVLLERSKLYSYKKEYGKAISDVNEVIKFLRAREIVHFQRFGEALRSVQDMQDCKHLFAMEKEMPNACNNQFCNG